MSGFVCAIATTAISLAAPWILKYAIDELAEGATLGRIRAYAAALIALAVLGAVFRFLMRRIIIGASRQFEYDLRNDFFAQLQRLDAAYFQHNRTGDLMSRATNDLGAVRMLIGPAVMYSATTGFTFVVATSLMLSINPWLTAVALVPLPFVTVSVRYFGAAIHRRFDAIQAQMSDVSSVTQESLAGVRVIRAYGQEPFEIARFQATNEEYFRRNRALVRLQGTYYPSMGLLMGIGALLVLWLGGRQVIGGPHVDRRTGRIQHLPHDARVAHDCLWLGHEPRSARYGVVEAAARGHGRDTGHRRLRSPGKGRSLERSRNPGRHRVSTSDVLRTEIRSSFATYPRRFPPAARLPSWGAPVPENRHF